MRVAFLHSDKPRELSLSTAFLRGARKAGHRIFAERIGEDSPPGTFDVVAMVGVKSNERFHAHQAAGSHVIMVDKGYNDAAPGDKRRWTRWRIAVDSHQPTRHLLARDYPEDRWLALGIEIQPWRKTGGHIVFAGSSAKYHAFQGLPDPTAYAQGVVAGLRRVTGREIVYRPKPSWADAVPVAGARFSKGSETMHDVLTGAWALVTHGSNSCFEAMCRGIPSVILGDAVARPISSTDLADIEAPRLAPDPERLRIVSALAYHQFTTVELARGMAWGTIAPELDA